MEKPAARALCILWGTAVPVHPKTYPARRSGRLPAMLGDSLLPPAPRPGAKGLLSEEQVLSNCLADTYGTGSRPGAGASFLTGGLSRAPPRVRPASKLSFHRAMCLI